MMVLNEPAWQEPKYILLVIGNKKEKKRKEKPNLKKMRKEKSENLKKVK